MSVSQSAIASVRARLNKKQKFVFLLSFFVFFLLLILSANPSASVAQSGIQWPLPQRIRGLADDSDAPFLVADQNQTVHAFNSQWTGNAGSRDLAVFYNQWTSVKGWSVPVDILLSPNKNQATVLGAFLDVRGTIHLVFFGGIAEGAEIYYSKAPAMNAGAASAWSAPAMIGNHAGSLPSGALTGDDKGNLFVVYTGNGEGNGLYEIHSTDWGATWSETKAVFLTNSDILWVFAIQAALDSKGQLHTVWTVDNKQGNGDAVYYSRLESDHNRWSMPVALQTRKDCSYEADWASILPYKDSLFVVYNCGSPATRWFRRSQDGGRTWSAPSQPFSLIGENGALVLLTDSKNTLYAILANRTSDSRVHGLWYSTWTGNAWEDPKAIVSGPRSSDFDPSRPKAVVSQGNMLVITWRNDPGPEMFPHVWFTYAKLDAPELPIVTLPTLLPRMTPIPTFTSIAARITSTPTPVSLPAIPLTDNETQTLVSEIDRTFSMVIPIIPVVLVLIILALVRNWQHSS